MSTENVVESPPILVQDRDGSQETPTPVVVQYVETPVEVKINPFTRNNQTMVDPLLPSLNEILDELEAEIATKCLEYNIDNTKNPYTIYLPKEISYIPTVTRVSDDGDGAFSLNRPKAALKVTYDKFMKDLYLDRVFLTPEDVKTMLQYPDKAKAILRSLVQNMFQNVINTKQLDVNKKYLGAKIATMSRPGQPGVYSSNYQDEYVEIRMFSDATEYVEGEIDEPNRESVESSQSS